ncbi:uncharacterized protein [Pseudochaenichthys georgianus]|uniref:uncharacterized protein isoform X2 n=1 Tax=Pseudochaenichthys georgianus TaxID=52239 RepID=UPI00146DB573|nr:uncharacterized protein LOC117460157 isoform X2 [Pseudochaenichthys georgianus]
MDRDTSYLNCKTFKHHPQDFPMKIFWDASDMKTITIFPSCGTELDKTAKDLLIMCLPYGKVINVQKIVFNGSTFGKELREAHENIISDILLEQPPSLLQPRLYDLPSQSFPSRLDTQHLPAHDKGVSLRVCNLPGHVDQMYQVHSLLPPCTTNVKKEKNGLLVTFPDISVASWFMSFLKDLFTGSSRLNISFANEEGGARPRKWRVRRKQNQWHL